MREGMLADEWEHGLAWCMSLTPWGMHCNELRFVPPPTETRSHAGCSAELGILCHSGNAIGILCHSGNAVV